MSERIEDNNARGFCKEDGCRCFATWPRGVKNADQEFCELHSPFAATQRIELAMQRERDMKLFLAAQARKAG